MTMLKLLSEGVSGAEIGRKFGIAKQSVYRYKERDKTCFERYLWVI